MAAVEDLLHTLSGVRVLVLGDAHLDGYLEGEAVLQADGQTPVVAVRRRLDLPGGAAGAAASVAALGGRAVLLSVVGDDPEARTLRRRLRDAGVHARLNLSGGRHTLVRRRIAADGGVLLRYDEGDVGPVPPANEAWLLDQLLGVWPDVDAVLVYDDGHGVMTPAVRAELRRLQQTDPRLLVTDGHDPCSYSDSGLTAPVLDAHEALLLVGGVDGRTRMEALERRAGDLLRVTGSQLVAIALDAGGAFFVDAAGPVHRTYARGVPARPSPAAGATFAAALTLALGAGAQTWMAAEIATAAAAVAASKGKTSACTLEELRLRLSPHEKAAPDVGRLAAALDDRRAHGQRIVFTAGRFGRLRRDHVALLERARAAGDLLVVGLVPDSPDGNETASPARDGIAALSCVDAIVPLAVEPADLVRALRPHTVVASGDGDEEAVLATAARETGADVVVVPRHPAPAVASLLERVRRSRPLLPLGEGAA